MAKAKKVTYGDRRRPWNDAFISYMNFIYDHHAYKGMPPCRDANGKIDWSIPSGRKKGSKNWDHRDRRINEFWRPKAVELGIPTAGRWIAKVAKRINPLQEKPCQTCGRIMKLAYIYPTKPTIAALNKQLPVGDVLEHDDFLPIEEVVDHFFTVLGAGAPAAIEVVFPATRGKTTADDIKDAIRSNYVQSESRLLGPGAMSNAPDRFDGFHTYNRCCRPKQDTGRSAKNLRSYGVDRRAYEQWSEGDWPAADSLMKQSAVGPCPECGLVEQLTADHIGPISLGFAHTPHFRPLCRACNSGKNNRMTYSDVETLLGIEQSGTTLASWQARSLWDACKSSVHDNGDALLLSKLMRINQHHFLWALDRAVRRGVPDCLVQFLELPRSQLKPIFHGLDAATLKYDRLEHSARNDTYASMKAARRVRIAFDSLREYAGKEKRNVQLVSDDSVRAELAAYDSALTHAATKTSALRESLSEVMNSSDSAATRDNRIAVLLAEHGATCGGCGDVQRALETLMAAYGRELRARFERGEEPSDEALLLDL